MNQDCAILADTFVYDVDDPKYPAEWGYDDEGNPGCRAFVEHGKQLPTARCTQTDDMFSRTPPTGGTQA